MSLSFFHVGTQEERTQLGAFFLFIGVNNMLKACSRCGRIHPDGECSVHYVRNYKKEYKGSENRTEEQRFRSTTQWQRKRWQILQRDGFCCRLCLYNHKIETHGLQVHHIVKMRENQSLRLEDTNLITLCPECHSIVERDNSLQPLLRKLTESRPYIEKL